MASNGCVIFSKDTEKMSRFYQTVLAMQVTESSESHEVLSNARLEIVIHGIDKKIAESINIESPPQLRANTAMKPVFDVASLESVRKACEQAGGGLQPADNIWELRGAKVIDGWDPEGNVIQFKQTNAS